MSKDFRNNKDIIDSNNENNKNKFEFTERDINIDNDVEFTKECNDERIIGIDDLRKKKMNKQTSSNSKGQGNSFMLVINQKGDIEFVSDKGVPDFMKDTDIIKKAKITIDPDFVNKTDDLFSNSNQSKENTTKIENPITSNKINEPDTDLINNINSINSNDNNNIIKGNLTNKAVLGNQPHEILDPFEEPTKNNNTMNILNKDINKINKKNYNIKREIISWITVICLALIIMQVIRTFVAEPMKVPTSSMVDTIQIDDQLYVNKLHYKFNKPKRGEIMVFWYPDLPIGNTRYVKRVIGLPEEKVEIKQGKVYINDIYLNEPYVKGPVRQENFGPYNVPVDSYFMMGDNRNNSKDSRYWSNPYVTNDRIIGKVFFRFWPLNRIGSVN